MVAFTVPEPVPKAVHEIISEIPLLKGNTVSAPAFVLYPVILPVESTIGVKPFKLSFSVILMFNIVVFRNK